MGAYLADMKHGVSPEGREERNKLSHKNLSTQEWGQSTQQLGERERERERERDARESHLDLMFAQTSVSSIMFVCG